jgi:hypothetical protein
LPCVADAASIRALLLSSGVDVWAVPRVVIWIATVEACAIPSVFMAHLVETAFVLGARIYTVTGEVSFLAAIVTLVVVGVFHSGEMPGDMTRITAIITVTAVLVPALESGMSRIATTHAIPAWYLHCRGF